MMTPMDDLDKSGRSLRMSSSVGTNGQLAGKKVESSIGYASYIRRFDIYSKLHEEYTVQTSGGATLSLVGWFVIAILIIGEFQNYMTPTITEHMVVDTTLGQQLRVNVNMTFHALTCNDVHLDAMDVAGDNQLNIEHDMLKQRISQTGFLIGTPTSEFIGKKNAVAKALPADYCGSCFGAETETRKCCNSCDVLKNAYDAKGWSHTDILMNSEQCIRDNVNPFANAVKGEGCRINGYMSVNKVAGNFHIAHGESIVRDGRHIHQFVPAEAHTFNISHTLHSISFGVPYPNMPPNPLDKVEFMVLPEGQGSTGLYQYFIKVVPTMFTDDRRGKLLTNQYTFTERFRPLMLPDPKSGLLTAQQSAVLPGIFFVYDLSPFMLDVHLSNMPLLHFVTKLLAIVGGVFTILGVVDSVLHKIMKKKNY